MPLTVIDAKYLDKIYQEQNLAVRNLRITWCYHLLSERMKKIVSAKNVTWPGFAKWASRSAGFTIRNEVASSHVRLMLSFSGSYKRAMASLCEHLANPKRAEGQTENELEHYLSHTFIGVADKVSQGNLAVFQEMAPLFANFMDLFIPDKKPDYDKLKRFQDSLKSGPPEEGGQDYLKQAFAAYYEAKFSRGQFKAELVLLANLLCGLQEQIRLQDAIAGAVNLPLEHGIREHLGQNLDDDQETIFERLHELALTPIANAWRKVAVETIMSLRLPEGSLALGDDIPDQEGGQMFPRELTELENEDVKNLLLRWDRNVESTEGSAAKDWADLGDRMNYICDLFRSRQQRRTLHHAPYTDEQVALIEAGELPPKPL